MRKKCIIIFALLTIFFMFVTLIFLSFLNIPVRQTKDYNSIFIDNNSIEANYEIFLFPPQEYSAIEQIEYSIRERIAHYMKINNLVLADGVQTFNRHNANYDELIREFDFEKISTNPTLPEETK